METLDLERRIAAIEDKQNPMSASLDRRIKKLEGVLPNREFMSMVLGLLREIGYEELRSKVASQGMAMPHALLLCVDDIGLS